MPLILGTIRDIYMSGKIQNFFVLKQVTIVICRYTIRTEVKMNIVHKIKSKKANWTDHILRSNYLLKHVIEGKIQRTRRRGRRCYHLLDDPKKERRYWTLKREALDSNLWRNRCGRGYGSITRLAQ